MMPRLCAKGKVVVFSGAIGREAEERPGNMRPYRRFGRALDVVSAGHNTLLD